MEVPAFAIAQHKVTNGEYLEFVEAGAAAPHFWICREGRWFYRGMFADIPLPLDWPVYVAYEQAQAYAAMEGKGAAHRSAVPSRGVPGGHKERETSSRENVDFRSWDPEPVTLRRPTDSAFRK